MAKTTTIAKTTRILPYDIVSSSGGILTIAINKEFDSGNLHQDWAQSIVTLHPGPFTSVRIDLSRCGSVSSTFFAGLVELYLALNPGGTQRVVLVDPDPRLLKNLNLLNLDTFFEIERRVNTGTGEGSGTRKGEGSGTRQIVKDPPPPT